MFYNPKKFPRPPISNWITMEGVASYMNFDPLTWSCSMQTFLTLNFNSKIMSQTVLTSMI